MCCAGEIHAGSDAQATPKLTGPPQGLSLEALGGVEGKPEAEGGMPLLTEQWRKRWMGAKGDEQIEIGPMIGRGGEHHGMLALCIAMTHPATLT